MFDAKPWGESFDVDRLLPKRRVSRIELHLKVLKVGRNVCFGKGGGGSAPAPDPQIGQAALDNVQLGKDWLSFAKDQFEQGNDRQVTTDALNTKVVDQQLATQDQANSWAKEDRARTKNVFQPVEDSFVKTATEYATPEKQAEAAAAAKADVIANSNVQRQGNIRQMAAMGINPNSGRFAGIQRAGELNTALGAASAQNNARQIVRDKGLALTADAVNIGKNLPSSTAAAYGIGTNAGNSAVANNQSANNSFNANSALMSNGYGGATNANSSSASILNNLYGNQLNSWNAQQQSNATSAAGTGQLIGSVAGAAAIFF